MSIWELGFRVSGFGFRGFGIQASRFLCSGFREWGGHHLAMLLG